MAFFKGLLRYSGLLMLSGWMFFMGVLVGRGTAPVEFDTGWFQERLAVIFDDSAEELQEVVDAKPELDFYSALQKSDLKEDYDLQINKSQTSEYGKDGKTSLISSVETTSDLALSDLQAPLKKSKKAMTKLGVKKTTPLTTSTSEQIEKSNLAAAKLDNAKNVIKITDIKNKLSEIKVIDKSANKLPQVGLSKIKISEQLPEAKSDQVKEYAQKVYSYTIQIASFNSEADALNHISKLGEKGYSAYKISGTVGEKTWYRIRTGNFNNITEAKESLKKLESSGIKGLIIQKDQ